MLAGVKSNPKDDYIYFGLLTLVPVMSKGYWVINRVNGCLFLELAAFDIGLVDFFISSFCRKVDILGLTLTKESFPLGDFDVTYLNFPLPILSLNIND